MRRASALCAALLCCGVPGRGRAQASEQPAPDASAADSPTITGAASDVESAEAQEPQEPQEPQAAEPSYGAATRVRSPTPPSAAFDAERARTLAGGLGDPFRMTETMPGAAPMASGLPYFYVRGSPPSGNVYSYDGIPLPQLYHLGLGPAVLHPTMLGAIDFIPGASPARFGRRVGAVIQAGAPRLDRSTHGEVELRLLDANAALVRPLGDGTVAVAGRFGYPGLLLPALGVDVRFSYWDYQLRAMLPVSDVDVVELVGIGSHDQLDNAAAVGASVGYDRTRQDLALDFQRLDARLIRRLAKLEIGSALLLGYDRSHIGESVSAHAYSLAPRLWFKQRLSGGQRLRLGADFTGAVGRVSDLPRSNGFDDTASQAVSRGTAGAYGELLLRPVAHTQLELGLRSDLWLIGGHAEATVDPRLRFTVYAGEGLRLHAGAGVVHQPVVFVFPLPGLTDVALDRGLQRALQGEVGAALTVTDDTEFETHLFVHRYEGLLLPEVYLRALGDDRARADVWAYGAEWFVRREASARLSGWVSYTLAWATAHDPVAARAFRPEFDIRHVLNVVTHLDLTDRLSAGVRFQGRSGKPVNQFSDQGLPPAQAVRLPLFLKLDARVGYRFTNRIGDADVYAEMLNVTLAREAIDARCFFDRCNMVQAAPVFFPNVGLRQQF